MPWLAPDFSTTWDYTGRSSSLDELGTQSGNNKAKHAQVEDSQNKPSAAQEPIDTLTVLSARTVAFDQEVQLLGDRVRKLIPVRDRVQTFQVALNHIHDRHRRKEQTKFIRTALEENERETRKETKNLAELRREQDEKLRTLKGEVDQASKDTKDAHGRLKGVNVQVDGLETDKIQMSREAEEKEREYKLANERQHVKEIELKLAKDALDDHQRELDDARSEERRRNAALARFRTVQLEHSAAVENYRKQRLYYGNSENLFVHLMDGGVADNLGFSPLVELLDSFFPPEDLSGETKSEWKTRTKYVAIIMVDARGIPEKNVASVRKAPGIIETLRTTVNTAIDGKSFVLGKELERISRKLEVDGVVENRFVVRADFDGITWETDSDEPLRCRTAYQQIPTNWKLEPETADALIELGRALVLNSSAYAELVKKLDGEMPEDIDSVASVCEKHVGFLVDSQRKRQEEKKKPEYHDDAPN